LFFEILFCKSIYFWENIDALFIRTFKSVCHGLFIKKFQTMFFLFSKLLSFFISPLTWILVLLIFSFFSKKANRKRNFLVIAVVLLLLFSNGFLFEQVQHHWDSPPVSRTSMKPHDYAVVLGGFSSYDTLHKNLRLTEVGDRIWQTMQLYYQKKAHKIFISGGSGRLLHQELSEADKVKAVLVLMHIPENDIIIDPTSRNTHENAVNTAKILNDKFPGGKFLLITSSMHMRRALGCFRHEGFEVTPFSTCLITGKRELDLKQFIVPNMEAMGMWDNLIHEVAGYLIYDMSGYL